MPDPKDNDKVLPCLLDRLTDHNPKAQQESRQERVLSMAQYREAVLRDLAWLLNTKAHLDDEDLIENADEVRRSVLNFGFQDVNGLSIGRVSPERLQQNLAECIRTFEPRIIPESLSVEIQLDREAMNSRALCFVIHGQLWASPSPEALYLRTEIDMESGHANLKQEA